ncbi:MAG: homocysteine S-methyltransferase family protein [Candidatus Aminicenantes bacterium]|nr:MAG: homocysteine S-methyltransferase family protein [Candidatus Aminicenantes bacterium]
MITNFLPISRKIIRTSPANEWFGSGARLIGGCCRMGPRHIKAMREALLKQGPYEP